MKNANHTIEDLLEVLAGMKQAAAMQIEPSDATIMYSIARQVFKGTALTDRQFVLMKEKLQTYRDQFVALDYDFDRAVESLRYPLRHIDRSKYIKIVKGTEVFKDQVIEAYKSDHKWIKIRFPFSKSLISLINDLPKFNNKYHHEKGSHEHYFILQENNIKNIIESFKNKNFDIDAELIECYNKIIEIENEKEKYIPGIYNNELCNLPDESKSLAKSEIGPLNNDNLIHYIDRKRRYGIINHPEIISDGSLLKDYINRKEKHVLSNVNNERLQNVLETIRLLDRFPLLVILDDETAEQDLYDCYQYFKNIIDNTEQSVMFRLDSNTNNEFNQLVKDYQLNNWVDKTTKIVYINRSKIPKPLLKSGWSPITAIAFGSSVFKHTDVYIEDTCDLIIMRDTEMSPLRRYSRYYG